MGNKRKQYSTQFKAKVALEAHRGEKTIAELASQYQLHPTVINNWKRRLLEGASGLFEKDAAASKADGTAQAQIDELYRQIGQLKVERDFLASKSRQSMTCIAGHDASSRIHLHSPVLSFPSPVTLFGSVLP